MIYVWSDTHFGNENIMRYEERQFATVYEMDESYIDVWNSTIQKDDIIIHGGDVSFHNADMTRMILSRLQGRKYLIIGNHDEGHSVKWWREAGFEQVFPYPICVDGFYWISHIDMYLTKAMPYVNIHGHTHHNCVVGSNYFNMCVDVQPKPVLLDSIKELFADKN